MPGVRTVNIITRRQLRAKLIFNATSGKPGESPQQLLDILEEMQRQRFLPEVVTIRPDVRVEAVVRRAIRDGIQWFVVAGGDGTIDSVAEVLAGTPATLGIIPVGTRNNLAFNLGIPSDIADAVALLREGRRMRIDVGHIQIGAAHRRFLEVAAMGLLSDLYPAADDIQHGNPARIPDLVTAFVASTASRLGIILDGRKRFDTQAHTVLIANMPFVGPRFQVAPGVSFNDGHLDVLVFSDTTKLDLISYAVQSVSGATDEPGVQHYRVKHLTIHSDPQMPVVADGFLLGNGPVTAAVQPHALRVVTGSAIKGEAEEAAGQGQAVAHE